MALKAGDWVEIRSKSEILQTLDDNARLDGMPFMPEMFQYCGKKYQVKSRAHKTCDPIYTYSSRRITDAVHLNLRCDGSAHGGCQTACLLFWKEAWLKTPTTATSSTATPAGADETPHSGKASTTATKGGCTEEKVYASAHRDGGSAMAATAETSYVCQTTQLCEFSERLSCWNMRQYFEDYSSGNVTLAQLVRGMFYVLMGRRFETEFTFVRRIYDLVQGVSGGIASPSKHGKLPDKSPFPLAPLNLTPGTLVRVKSHEEILNTIRSDNFHRGLYFDVEMVPFCGRIYRVKQRVDKFIDEKTGKMRALKTPAVILEDVWCTGQYSKCRMFCPRSLHSWWREEWLERVAEAPTADGQRVEVQHARAGKSELEEHGSHT